MARWMHRTTTEVFRVVVTTTYRGVTIVEAFGTYSNLSAARGIVTSLEKNKTSGWRPVDTFVAAIEKSPVQWETVETVS